jgi:hypothetical protein
MDKARDLLFPHKVNKTQAVGQQFSRKQHNNNNNNNNNNVH